MPIIKSAKKKLRQDRKREKINNKQRHLLKEALKSVKKSGASQASRKAVKLIDKMAKKHLLHKNKAARLKSRIAKLTKEPSKKAPK